MNRNLSGILCLILLATIILSCASHKKVFMLTPGEESNAGIVYKTASAEVNGQTKAILMASLKNLSTGFFNDKLPRDPFLCGPILWSQIKGMIPVNDSIGVSTTVIGPELDPNEPDKSYKMEARILRKEADISHFMGLLNTFLNKPDSFKIRNLTEEEKSLYWTYIAWNIEEPVFIVETNNKLLLIDLMKNKNNWQIFYMDEYSTIIDEWKDIQNIRSRRDSVHSLAKSDRLVEAEAEALKVVAESEKIYGKKDKNYGMALVNLGTIYAQASNSAKAETLYLQAIDVFMDALGPINTYIVQVYNNLSSIYDCQSRYSDGEIVLKKALYICEKTFGSEDQNTAILYTSLASNAKNRKEYEQSLQYHHMAINLFEKKFGLDNPNLAIEYSNIGEYYFDMQNYKTADTAYKKAEAILIKALGPEHYITIGIRAHVARNLVYLKKYEEAEPLLLNSIAYTLKKKKRIDRSLLESVESFGKFIRETDNTKKALDYEAWAQEIKDKTTPESSCNVIVEE